MLSEEDVKKALWVSQHKAAMETTRAASFKGWLFIILPLTLIITMMLIYGLQEATGVQAYTLLTEPRNLQGQPLNGGQTGFKSILARILLLLIVGFAVLFLVQSWKKQGGATGWLVGGRVGRSSAYQTDAHAFQDVVDDSEITNAAKIQAMKANDAYIARTREKIVGEAKMIGASASERAHSAVQQQYDQAERMTQAFKQGAATPDTQSGFDGTPSPPQQGDAALGYPPVSKNEQPAFDYLKPDVLPAS